MDNPYIGRVNQQLIFARHQLQLRVDAANGSERMRNQGLLNAGIWHLSWAYRAYLAEVGANYKLTKPERASSAAQLSDALEAINKHPGEAQELQRLEQTGFVRDLLAALQSIEQIEAGLIAPAPSDQAQENPLQLTDLTGIEDCVQADFSMLSSWIDAFKELVARHREHMIEY